MPPRVLALAFVQAFGAADLPRLAVLLAENVHVEGPFLSVDSRAAYLRALADLEPAPTEVLRVFEDGDEAAVFYAVGKAQGALVVAQRFRVHAGQIVWTQLVFDGRGA